MRHNVEHNIMQIISPDSENTHEVFLRIPLENGWIDNVKFYIWKENEQQELPMDFDGMDEKYAYFKTVANLSSCQHNYYFFSYEVDGRILFDRHVNGHYKWKLEDEEILKFYLDVIEYTKSGEVLQNVHRILEISWEHLVAEQFCGKNKVVIIANRSDRKLRIFIPREYYYSQVAFCTEGSDCEILLPNGAIVLKK